MPIIIDNNDLRNNKYSIDDLIRNIDNLSLWNILQTQILTADFCFIYFWSHNDEYAKDKDDTEICEHDVLRWQPHLTKEDLSSCAIYRERINNNNI